MTSSNQSVSEENTLVRGFRSTWEGIIIQAIPHKGTKNTTFYLRTISREESQPKIASDSAALCQEVGNKTCADFSP